ncbi:hypothetical protein CPB84DRAFT_1321116 [Gymnopilus junonius]|uniref:Uncharacterized protein n=1 Tax=Gymnopilus junonius TaxID=109634 RepID=A0A9P5NMC5_GYMJU|nr:hypothetical protein CPB84DRAFT_1321116 [Gymnopilus junonius]
MFSLFDGPDPGLQNALYQTWTSDPRVSESNTLPELLPLLFDDERLRNSSIKALLRELTPAMVPRLTSRRRLDILVRALMINDVNVVRSFLQETCTVIENSNENEKGWFAAEPSFVSAIGEHLKGHDPTMHRHSSIIIQILSVGSTSRSGRIMNEGIGQYLSWVAVNGETGAQQS